MPSSPFDRIHALPVQLANQIAAGEVVERPASVVKELIENSIDAGATRIDIDLREGGKSLIRVEDNGNGIHADDFKLALTRHATSKIHDVNDLQAIHSLGFRGEALPSIASVCRFEMSSRYYDSEQAWHVSVDPQGHMSGLQPHAQPCGTTVTVAELFCNTPARRRFLRAARTEFLHIQDVVIRAALSRFDIGFSLKHNGKHVLRLPAITDASLRHRRLAAVGGKQFEQALFAIDEQREGIHVHGWLAPAEAHRAQADRQFVFINGRMVRDKVLNHAIRQAYADALPPGRYAMYALYIELDSSRVDVNVHPTKHEVRFREVRPVHDVLFSAVQHGLAGQTGFVEQAVSRSVVNSVQESAPVYALQTHSPIRQRHTSTANSLNVLAILPGGFVLVKDNDDYYIYNLQRVAENVFSARLQRQQADRGVLARPLLIPQRLNVSESHADQFESAHDELLAYGIDLTRSGGQSLLLRSLPDAVGQIESECFINTIASQSHISVETVAASAAQCLASQFSISDSRMLVNELRETVHEQYRRRLTANDLHVLFHQG